ncbi:MAG: glycosyltransferase family 1 protein [Candidatus Falkowbacteria bacterium]
MNKIKKIGIDARFYGPIGKGLGRYIQEVVDNVIKIDTENKYVIFLGSDNFDEFTCDNKNVKKVLTDAKWYSLSEQVKMPFLIWKEHLDLIHFPHFNVPIFCPTKFVVTIHDLILTKFPTQRATTLSPIFYKIKNLAYKIIIWSAVKRSKKIIAVSEFTKNDIVKQFKVKSKKIIVTYEGVANLAKGRDSLFAKKLDDKKTLLGYNINSPFLLYVGNAYPHKNLEGLIRIFKIINSENSGLRLVLVGKEDYFYERVKNYAKELDLFNEDENNSRIIFPGYVPDAQLEILFKKAVAYIFPSLYEGFGLPPLEAMAKGCPVVSSNKASMPEILGDVAIYFNPENKDEMLYQIKKIINNQDLRDKLIKKGYEQVKKYSWWECANKTLGVYNNIINKPHAEQ